MLPNAVDCRKSCFLVFTYGPKQANGQSGLLQLVHMYIYSQKSIQDHMGVIDGIAQATPEAP